MHHQLWNYIFSCDAKVIYTRTVFFRIGYIQPTYFCSFWDVRWFSEYKLMRKDTLYNDRYTHLLRCVHAQLWTIDTQLWILQLNLWYFPRGLRFLENYMKYLKFPKNHRNFPKLLKFELTLRFILLLIYPTHANILISFLFSGN